MTTSDKDRAAFEAAQTAPKQHPDDVAVDRFAKRMKWKLSVARERGRSGWQDRTWTPEQISAELRRHVAKGDPLDVANYCMFLYERCEPITPLEDQDATAAERERAAKVCLSVLNADGDVEWAALECEKKIRSGE